MNMNTKSTIGNLFFAKAAGIVFALAFLLCGCAGDTKVIEGEVKTLSTEGSVSKAVPAGAQDVPAQNAAENYKGYTFVYNDVVIAVDADAALVVERLGEANSYFEAPSCAFEGIDKVYTYNSFELDTCPINDTDIISAVILKDDAVATSEGISIGDAADKVTDIYGTGKTDEEGMMVYEKDGMRLCFIIQDGKVASVEYRSMILEE